VDLDRFVPQERDINLVERYGLQSSKVVLSIGRLEHQERYKGFDEVIEVMPLLLKQFPALKYLIIGDGTDRLRLEAKARALGIESSVIFAGRIAESEKVAHYNLADAFVMPSRGEGFGIVFIEAAACGVPVIAGGTDASRETLLDGELGCLVDSTNPSALIEAIVAALESRLTRERNPRIATFSGTAFRARVNEWCGSQLKKQKR
jgi:glycosyltransferase involved in cell wall biosynthesis